MNCDHFTRESAVLLVSLHLHPNADFRGRSHRLDVGGARMMRPGDQPTAFARAAAEVATRQTFEFWLDCLMGLEGLGVET